MKVIGNRITKMTIELTMEDGSIQEEEVEVDADYKELTGIDSDQEFWVATNHPRLLTGTHAFASPMDPETVSEESRDWTNTMIGMIRDGNCVAFVTYDTEPVAKVK